MRRVRIYPTLNIADLKRHLFGYTSSAQPTLLYLIIIFLVIMPKVLFGQTREDQVPEYEFLFGKSLPTVRATLFPPSANTDDLTIAIATDPVGNVYTLTFGKGVEKRDADGNLLDGNFINGLNSPTDIAVDEDGLIYIADFEAAGEDFRDNGRILIFDSTGTLIETIYTSYFRPMGIAVDEENLYVAEYNDGKQGPESTPSGQVRIVNKTTVVEEAMTTAVEMPFRIAVNSKGDVFVAQAGAEDEVVIFNQELSRIGQLEGVVSPGSIEIDVFDYIHVIEYAGLIDFTRFLNMETKELLEMAEKIDQGIEEEKFGIKIFSPNLTFQKFYKERIDFPVDIAFNSCDRMYVNNAMLYGNSTFLGYIPEKMEFDLEIYARTPSADVTDPVAACVGTHTINVPPGETVILEPDALDNGSWDQCGEVTLSLSKDSFTEEDVGQVTTMLTVTDEQGQTSSCSVTVVVNVEEIADNEAPVFKNCVNVEFSADPGECGAVVNFEKPLATDNSGGVVVTQIAGMTPGSFFELGSHPVKFEARDAAGNVASCEFQVIVTDNEAPKFTTCIDNEVHYIEPVDGVYRVPDYRNDVSVRDNCTSVQEIRLTQSILPGTEITEGTYIHIFAYDEYGNESVSCSFEVALSPAEPSFECASAEGETVKVDENCQYEQRDFSHLIINEKNFVDGITTEQTEVLDGDTLNVKIRVYHGEANDPDKTFIGECVFEIPVVDQNLPQILSCDASEVIVSMSSGESYEIPDFSSRITGADNCSFEIVQSPSPGTRITETETVKLWLEDPAGNRSSTTCEFKVILQEKEPLMITSCPETDQLTLGENCEAELPDYTQQVETDGEPVTLAQLPAPGSVITGRTEVKITATGSSGETDSCTFWVELEDDMPPAITCITELSFSYDPEFGYEVPDLSSMLEISDNCGFSVRQVPAPGTVISNSQEIEIVAVDMAGNQTLCSFQLNLQATSSFLINCPKAQTGFLEENCAVEVPDFRSKTQVTNPDAVVTQNPPPGTLVTSRTTIEMIATSGDLRATCQFDFEVVDNLKPEISCTPISINLDAEGTATITPEMLAQFEDNCGIVQAEVSKSSFTEEHLGSQPVTVTVRDAAGNENQCVTTVQVEPYEGISEGFKCPEPTTIALKSNGELNISVYYPGEAELEFEISQSHFTCADIGTHTLTITYTGDFNGTCEAELTVIDDTPPEIVCLEEYTLTLNSEGKAVVKAEDLLSKAYDNCGIADAVLSRNAFSTADIGQQEISLTVTDQSGNVSTCLVPLQVRAYEASPDPFTCVEALTLELDPEGHAKLNPRDLFSGGASVQFSVDKEEFTCEDLGTTIVTLTYSTPEESGSCQIPVTIIDPEERCNAGPVEPPLEEVFLLLYPNPNEGIFNITGTRKIILERAEVFDARGRFLFARKLEKPDGPKMVYRFDLTEFQSGVYTIKLYAKDEIFIRRAIIRNE